MSPSKHLIYALLATALFISCSRQNPGNQKDVQPGKKSLHTFTFEGTNFMLDGKPFQIISGEMHYTRIPKAHWRQRIRLAKAMGCNTIATYVFWSYHETSRGQFDFKTGNRDLAEFINLVQEEDMWLLFRPGPYSCGEWDLGGIPPYLLSIPDIRLRCMDKRYMSAVERYIKKLAGIVKPFLITNGGPVIMVQIENEYGSFGNDRQYMQRLKALWEAEGIDVPYYTSDGATAYMLEAGTLPGCAVGLDPGAIQKNFDLAHKMNPGIPVFSSETYPGWLTHWGEPWAQQDTTNFFRQIRFLMDNRRSFNLYMLSGGTNFGFTAGANSGGKGYEPDVTSYDYGAPVNEAGEPTEKYFKLRNIIGSYPAGINAKTELPAVAELMEIPEIKMEKFTTVWDRLPEPVFSVIPKPFEYYDHYYGFTLYKTRLVGRKQGTLKITHLHDYATVFLDGRYIGKVDRRLGEQTINLPETNNKNPILEIFVEGMGRINFGQHLIDRKGITERVTLNGMTLFNWEVYLLPMDTPYIQGLKKGVTTDRQGIFYKGNFTLDKTADTYIDVSNYKKGVVWVNGHNLGRYWETGPQHSLYCPVSFLRKGSNEIILFDLHRTDARPVRGIKKLL